MQSAALECGAMKRKAPGGTARADSTPEESMRLRSFARRSRAKLRAFRREWKVQASFSQGAIDFGKGNVRLGKEEQPRPAWNGF